MRDLAVRVLPVYQESDATRYLNNLSALQLVAGSIDSAWTTRQSLLERRRPQEAGKPIRQAVIFDLYLRARALAAQGPIPVRRGLYAGLSADRAAAVGPRCLHAQWLAGASGVPVP